MTARFAAPRYAAVVWDRDREHVFSSSSLPRMLRDIRLALGATQAAIADPLRELAAEPIDAVAVARALGVSKAVANARLARAWRSGVLTKLRRGVYQAA